MDSCTSAPRPIHSQKFLTPSVFHRTEDKAAIDNYTLEPRFHGTVNVLSLHTPMAPETNRIQYCIAERFRKLSKQIRIIYRESSRSKAVKHPKRSRKNWSSETSTLRKSCKLGDFKTLPDVLLFTLGGCDIFKRLSKWFKLSDHEVSKRLSLSLLTSRLYQMCVLSHLQTPRLKRRKAPCNGRCPSPTHTHTDWFFKLRGKCTRNTFRIGYLSLHATLFDKDIITTARHPKGFQNDSSSEAWRLPESFKFGNSKQAFTRCALSPLAPSLYL